MVVHAICSKKQDAPVQKSRRRRAHGRPMSKMGGPLNVRKESRQASKRNKETGPTCFGEEKMAEMASSGGEEASMEQQTKKQESQASSLSSITSMAEDLQHSVIQSTRSLQQNSSAHLRTLQDFVPRAVSRCKSYEDAFFIKIKGQSLLVIIFILNL